MHLVSTSKFLYFFVAFLLITSSNLVIADSPSHFTIDQLIEESQKMFSGERYPESIKYASFAVKMAESNSNDIYNSNIIKPLINLANIQKKIQSDDEAIKSYKRVVDLIERDGGIFDPRLVQPINHTGQLLQKKDKHEEAIKLFHRSQHISHRVGGVYNPNQISALNLMTNSYLLTGEFDKANDAQNFRYAIAWNQYGQGSLLSVPSMVNLAKFKSSLRMYDDAWALYAEAIQITETYLGKNHLMLVDLLLGLASTMQSQEAFGEYNQINSSKIDYQFNVAQLSTIKPVKTQLSPKRSNPKEAFNALNRAVQIVDYHKEKISLINRISIYMNFGDLCMVTRKKTKEGIVIYQQVIRLFDAENNAQELKQQYFGQPTRLKYRKIKLLQTSNKKQPIYDVIFIEATFVILPNGSVKNVKIVASNASVFMRTEFKKEVRNSIYRPQFVNGEPISTTQSFREEFIGESSTT